MPVDIVETDQISRCIIYAKFFKNNVHTNAVLWAFGATKPDGKAHESAVLRRIASTDGEVHSIGCSIAEQQNTSNGLGDEDTKRRFYVGFRTASISDINPIVDDDYEIHITNIPEHGVESHVDVALAYKTSDRQLRAEARTNAGLALAEVFGHPVPHRCICDVDNKNHPFDRWGEDCLTRGLTNGRFTDGSVMNQVAPSDNLAPN